MCGFGRRMQMHLALIIFLAIGSVHASKLNWTVKKEVGKDNTIWKCLFSNDLRASSQSINDSGEMNLLKDREKIVKDLNENKKKGLEFIGVKNWKPEKTKWDNDTLVMQGNYRDRDGEIVYFDERHYFNKKRVIILLLTSSHKENLINEKSLSFFEVAKSWEEAK